MHDYYHWREGAAVVVAVAMVMVLYNDWMKLMFVAYHDKPY